MLEKWMVRKGLSLGESHFTPLQPLARSCPIDKVRESGNVSPKDIVGGLHF